MAILLVLLLVLFNTVICKADGGGKSKDPLDTPAVQKYYDRGEEYGGKGKVEDCKNHQQLWDNFELSVTEIVNQLVKKPKDLTSKKPWRKNRFELLRRYRRVKRKVLELNRVNIEKYCKNSWKVFKKFRNFETFNPFFPIFLNFPQF